MRRHLPPFGKDHAAALLLLAIGAYAIVEGFDFEFGTLNRMGAGFIPVCIGALLVAVGIAMGVAAVFPSGSKPRPALPAHALTQGVPRRAGLSNAWRAWICILAGVAAFVVLGRWGGLVPASFVSVFVAACGDKESTVRGSLALSAALTLFCVAVFHYGLHLQLPLFQWS